MKTKKLYNQSELARIIGVHPSYINKVLNGKVKSLKLEKKIKDVISKISFKDIKAA